MGKKGGNALQPLFTILSLSLLMNFSSALEAVEQTHKMESTVNAQSEVKINYKVKGRDVFVECIIPGFTFNTNERNRAIKGEGHIHVYLNGKKFQDVHQAAFVLKDLPIGKHEIMLKFVQNNNKPYNYTKSFLVSIN